MDARTLHRPIDGLLRRWSITPAITAALLLVLLPTSAFAQQRQVTGVEAIRLLISSRKYADAEKFAYATIWQDIHQPEVLALLAQAIDSQKRPEDAAIWYTLTLRAVGEAGLSKTDAAKYKTMADRRLVVLNKDWETQKAKHEKAAAGKKFESPEKVDDGWMTQASSGLKTLHGLYAWKYVGGRKDRPADWIMNAQGAMHRSGLKRIDTLDGRTGILFSSFNPEAEPTPARPLVNRIALKNVGGCRYLRIGTRGYNFPYGLKVAVGDREVLSQKVGEKQWSDLKIDLGESPTKGEPVTLMMFKPDGQKYHEGAWFDYADFFVD